MKQTITVLVWLLTSLLSANVVLAQQTDEQQMNRKQQVRAMMHDSTMRAMMMKHMAQNPQMRKQMMQHMMQSMKMDGQEGMHMQQMHQQMMNNPEMKERMKAHMQMMRSMMEGRMDHAAMQKMMRDSSMVPMHLQCMQLMHTAGEDQMHQQDMKNGNGNHSQHHN